MSAPVRLLSVIVPCRNEREHILAFCDAVAAQTLPSGVRMEVLIADGCSDDGSRDCIVQRGQIDPRFVLVDNPGRIVSTGLNACIAQSRGEVIARMDVHTFYAPDYLAQCLEALARTGADNVGGPWLAEGREPMQRAVAAAFQSRWVSGGARSRELSYEGPADTVYLGCWPRESLARFGGFDETLVRNQDDEHNLRITAGGGRIWQSARIRSSYRPRGRLAQVARQYLQYGYWKPFVMRKHGQAAALRHGVPAALVLGLLLGALGMALRLPLAGPALGALLAAYAAFVAAATAQAAHGAQAPLVPRIAAVIVTYHLSYGWGSLLGAWDALVRGRPRARFSALTR